MRSVRERNIGQVNPENRFATGFLGQKCIIFEPIVNCGTRYNHIPTPFFSCSGPRSQAWRTLRAHSMCFSVSRIDPFFASVQIEGARRDGPNIGCFSGQNVGALSLVDRETAILTLFSVCRN